MTRAAVVLIAALSLAACGSDRGAGGSTGTRSSADDGPAAAAFRFANCMRENGVRDFPDPEVEGNRVKLGGPGTTVRPDDPKVRAAHAKCEKHLKGGAEDLSPAQQAEMRDVGVKLAECMRAHGIADFPDPQADGSIQIRRGAGPNPESAQFQAAQKACEPIMEAAREKAEAER